MRNSQSQPDRWVAQMGRAWDQFWFAPSPEPKGTLRVLVCLVGAVWMSLQLFNSDWYFGEQGWMQADLARSLSVATEGGWPARFRVSPLWATSAAVLFQAVAFLGIVLATLAALGIAARWSLLGLCLCCLGLAQRLTWATGTTEPFLLALLAYLMVDPGASFVRTQATTVHRVQERWTATLSRRLIQTHLCLLLAAGLASQLSFEVWWNGQAVWWLAATGHSNLLSVESFRGRELLINALTHGMILSSTLALLTLWKPRLNKLGVVSTCSVAFGHAFLADQLLYGGLLNRKASCRERV